MKNIKKLVSLIGVGCMLMSSAVYAAPSYDASSNSVNADADSVQTVLVLDNSEQCVYFDTANGGLNDVSQLLVMGETLEAGEYIVRTKSLSGDVTNAVLVVEPKEEDTDVSFYEVGRSEETTVVVNEEEVAVSDRGFNATVDMANPTLVITFSYKGRSYKYSKSLGCSVSAVMGVQVNNVPVVINDMVVSVKEAE